MINLTQERKAIALQEKQTIELKRNMFKKQLDDKLKDISTFIMKNDKLTETILSLPNDEVKCILNEMLASDKFAALFENTIENSTELAALRKRKSDKKARRQQKANEQDASADERTESVPCP